MEYAFHFHNTMAATGMMMALKRMLPAGEKPPVVLCIGSDLAVGDSLGPLTGTLLCRAGFPGFVYGTLKTPVTAKEVRYLDPFLRKTHPGSKIIAVDAAGLGGTRFRGSYRKARQAPAGETTPFFTQMICSSSMDAPRLQ